MEATDKSKMTELRSWHQLVSAMLGTGIPVSDLFQPGHLAGVDSPVHSAADSAKVVDWLVFVRFKKVCFALTPILCKRLSAAVLLQAPLTLCLGLLLLSCASLQDILGDERLLEKALQALVTPELLPGFLVGASKLFLAINVHEADVGMNCRNIG